MDMETEILTGINLTETTFEASPGGPAVSAVLVMPERPAALMVLGHGAGAPIHTRLMVKLAEGLADHGVATFRYNYPYSESMEGDYVYGMLDTLDVLLDTLGSAIGVARRLAPELPLFLGGRSMSSQLMSTALARDPWPDVLGLVLFVFPMRWHDLFDDTVGHLQRVPVPMLFVQGSRDDLTDVDELRHVLAGLDSSASLHVVEGADHSYDLPDGTADEGRDVLAEVASVTAKWIRERLPEGRPSGDAGGCSRFEIRLADH